MVKAKSKQKANGSHKAKGHKPRGHDPFCFANRAKGSDNSNVLALPVTSYFVNRRDRMAEL